ncbi:MAG: hemolysin D [Gammaproteobacteria bacterium]|jgi:hemolysin D
MKLKSDSLEFLPAALELERTPPLPASRYIMWSIMCFFTIGIAWACFGEVDIVSVAQGKIIPSGKVKTVQALEAGIVKAIHVREGDHVESGSILVELQDTKVVADLTRLRHESSAAQRERKRIALQLHALDQYKTPQDFFQRKSDSEINSSVVTSSSNALIVSTLAEYYSSVATIEEQMNGNRAEKITVIRRIEQLDATIPLLAERTASIKELENRSLAPRAEWLELQEAKVTKEKDREVYRAQLNVFDAGDASLVQRRSALQEQTKSTWLSEISALDTQLQSFVQEILKAQTRVTERQLTAPVSGTVQQLIVNTLGAVVGAGEKLMIIVPDSDSLKVEAWIPNKDIGFLHNDQFAEIKVETFPFTKYGVIDAKILSISNDAIPNETLGLVYLAQLEMATSALWVNNRLVKLSPGMAVTVEVSIGKRRLIEFLLAPLLRYTDEALQER